VALAILSGFLVSAAGCGAYSNKPPGVTPPSAEQRDQTKEPGVAQGEQKIKSHIENLTFEKEGRTLAAARNLGSEGANAAIAIPKLRELIAVEPDKDGFPNPKQKAAYQKALDDIVADMQKQGIPVPTEGASPEAKK
jgi:hypothetical protein